MKAKVNSTAHGDSVPATETAGDVLGLVTKPIVARAVKLSQRSIDNLQKRRVIPFIKISPRCVRYHLPSVIRALRKLEIREAGR